MPNYRRTNLKGGTYFFTVVTYRRRKILTLPASREILRNSIAETRTRLPFKVLAWVLLPDHMHCLWTLPEGDSDFSKRWGLIKANFSKRARGLFHEAAWMTSSKHKHRESTVWQRRFWEHGIRDEEDLVRHMEYIHYNPVKHGYVSRVGDWPFSTFHRLVRVGEYGDDWIGDDEKWEGVGFGE